MHIQFICEHISSIDVYHCGSRWWDVMAGLTYAADLINGVWVFEWDKWDWESEREHKYGGSSKSKCDVAGWVWKKQPPPISFHASFKRVNPISITAYCWTITTFNVVLDCCFDQSVLCRLATWLWVNINLLTALWWMKRASSVCACLCVCNHHQGCMATHTRAYQNCNTRSYMHTSDTCSRT